MKKPNAKQHWSNNVPPPKQQENFAVPAASSKEAKEVTFLESSRLSEVFDGTFGQTGKRDVVN